MCACVCGRVQLNSAQNSAQGASKLIFGAAVVLRGEVQKCQTGVCGLDLDLANEFKVLRSRNFDWPYLRHVLLSQNQNDWCSGHTLPTSLTHMNQKSEFNLEI